MNGEEIIWIKMSGWKPDNLGGRVSNPSKRADVAGAIRLTASDWKPDDYGGRVFNPSNKVDAVELKWSATSG